MLLFDCAAIKRVVVHRPLTLFVAVVAVLVCSQRVLGQGSGDDAEQGVRVRVVLPEERCGGRHAGLAGVRVRSPHPEAGVGQAEPGKHAFVCVGFLSALF